LGKVPVGRDKIPCFHNSSDLRSKRQKFIVAHYMLR